MKISHLFDGVGLAIVAVPLMSLSELMIHKVLPHSTASALFVLAGASLLAFGDLLSDGGH